MRVNVRIFLNKIFPWVKKISPVLLILALMIPLRFINLGYSEYICDESVALDWLRVKESFYSTDFLLNQHKGPVQYLIAGLIFLFSKNLYNEFIFRLPFAIANCASLVVFYFFIKNLTKNKLTAFISALLLGVNGMLVAFGRIMQYQSFNLLFSLLSMYFYSKLAEDNLKKDNEKESSLLKHSFLGTLFFYLSLLSHWDAVFILPYIVFVIIKDVLFKNELVKKFKSKFIVLNLIILFILVSFYFIPYIINFLNNAENQIYFQKRVNPSSISLNKFIERIKFIIFRIRLYNPILFFEFHLSVLLLSLVFLKKTWFYIIWFVTEIFIFIAIFTNFGTHIYNIFIPLLVIFSLILNESVNFIKSKNKIIKKIAGSFMAVLVIGSISFLYYQSYTLFVDHTLEYPWRKKKVINFEVGNFTNTEKEKYLTNNKIGFPLRREWEKIESVLSAYEESNGIKIGSTKIQTNENICPVSFYTGRKVSDFGNRFIVAIRYPLSLVNDYKRFSDEKEKDAISEIKNIDGNVVAKIYITR